MAASPPPHGFLESFRFFADGLLKSAQERVELFSLELQEEKLRLIQTFIWISAASFAAAIALIFGSLTVVYLLWDTARVALLGGLTVVYTAAAVAIVVAFRQFLTRQPRALGATIDELKQDRACIPTES
jgi:uncharacterized membrane protein YqjE